ncbi:CBS domain-containing protein [Agarivorans sp. MS3-6]
MNSRVTSFMESNVISVELDDSAEKVCEVLDANKLHCVPVLTPDGKIFGVISATDLVHFNTLHVNPKLEHAWELCTHKVIEVAPDMSVQEAGELMVKEKVHHLVVMEGTFFIGIVSATDILRAYLNK